MKLIASGRASDILDIGDGRVFRRFKRGGDAELEALVMRHAHKAGYPAPRVLDVSSEGLVLERIDGPTMGAATGRRPWTLGRNALLLAQLHRALHAIAAPPELRDLGPDDRLLHIDLHPENVILSPRGPIVIDWSNAHRGAPALDVAMTWVILATGAGLPGRVFLRSFLRHVARDEARLALPAAAEFRLADPHVSDAERQAVRRLVTRALPTRRKD